MDYLDRYLRIKASKDVGTITGVITANGQYARTSGLPFRLGDERNIYAEVSLRAEPATEFTYVTALETGTPDNTYEDIVFEAIIDEMLHGCNKTIYNQIKVILYEISYEENEVEHAIYWATVDAIRKIFLFGNTVFEVLGMLDSLCKRPALWIHDTSFHSFQTFVRGYVFGLLQYGMYPSRHSEGFSDWVSRKYGYKPSIPWYSIVDKLYSIDDDKIAATYRLFEEYFTSSSAF